MASRRRQRATDNSAKGQTSDGHGDWKKRRARYFIGATVSLGAAAALAREGQLPDVFFDWDNQVEWEEVHQLAQLSNMTNKSPSLIRKWFDCHGYTGRLTVRDLPKASTRYFVHGGHLPGKEGEPVYHVAIRGTVSLSDLNIDFKTRLEFDEECACVLHAGFKEVADAVADDIVQFLQPGAAVKLTGHSLGGAAATIVAAKLRIRGYKVGKVITFGAPKVTDARGAERLRGFLPLLRVTHERDPVPLMPFARADWKVALADQEEVADTVLDAAGLAGEDHRGEAVARLEGARGGAGDGDEADERVRGLPEKSWMAYSHFGSQVILVQRDACMECWREENASSSGASLQGTNTKTFPGKLAASWDDAWGPELGPDEAGAEAAGGVVEEWDCGHCPSQGRSYFDPQGDESCVFDAAWSRLSSVNFTHRMNSYEREALERRDHMLRSREAASATVPLEASALASAPLGSPQPTHPLAREGTDDERPEDREEDRAVLA